MYQKVKSIKRFSESDSLKFDSKHSLCILPLESPCFSSGHPTRMFYADGKWTIRRSLTPSPIADTADMDDIDSG